MLTKADIAFTFSRSRMNDNYVYIQRNDGKRKASESFRVIFKDSFYQSIHYDGCFINEFTGLL